MKYLHNTRISPLHLLPAAVILLAMTLTVPVHGGQSLLVDSHVNICGKTTERDIVERAEQVALESAQAAVAALKIPEAAGAKLRAAYRTATVKTLAALGSAPNGTDGCTRYSRRVEVIPDKRVIESLRPDENAQLESDPGAPLAVKVWTGRLAYREGEKITIFLKGNKTFYAKVVYRDASGNLAQLLPNPYRQENLIAGGEQVELPSGSDRFELEVTPPFGTETIIVYAATAPVGELQLAAADTVYQVQTAFDKVPLLSRGVRPKSQAKKDTFITEFSEIMAVVIVTKRE